MKNIKYLCIEYEIIIGFRLLIEIYFSPSIITNKGYLNKYNIIYLFDELFCNTITNCTKYQCKVG